MMSPEEDLQRSLPNEGETWLFHDRGKMFQAVIYEADPRSGSDRPEIAYRDPEDVKSGFKFNSIHDPLPVRRVAESTGEGNTKKQPVTVMVTLPLSQAEYRMLYKSRALTAPGTVFGVVREALGLKSEPHGYKTYEMQNEEDYLKEAENQS